MRTNYGKGKKRSRRRASKAQKLFHEIKENRLYPILKFLIKFNLFAIPLYIILLSNLQWGWLESVVANLSYFFIQAIGIPATKTANFIAIPVINGHWGAYINWDCTAWKSLLAFFALVMATDFPGNRKIRGILIFLPAIFIINIIRIVFIFYFVYAFDLEHFAIMHAVVWSWGLIITILAFWIIWIKWSMKIKGKPVRSMNSDKKR